MQEKVHEVKRDNILAGQLILIRALDEILPVVYYSMFYTVLPLSILYIYSMWPSVPNHLHNDDGRLRMTSIQPVCGDILVN